MLCFLFLFGAVFLDRSLLVCAHRTPNEKQSINKKRTQSVFTCSYTCFDPAHIEHKASPCAPSLSSLSSSPLISFWIFFSTLAFVCAQQNFYRANFRITFFLLFLSFDPSFKLRTQKFQHDFNHLQRESSNIIHMNFAGGNRFLLHSECGTRTLSDESTYKFMYFLLVIGPKNNLVAAVMNRCTFTCKTFNSQSIKKLLVDTILVQSNPRMHWSSLQDQFELDFEGADIPAKMDPTNKMKVR